MDREKMIFEKMVGKMVSGAYANTEFVFGNKRLAPESVYAYDGYLPLLASQAYVLGLPGFKNMRVDTSNENISRMTNKVFDLDGSSMVVATLAVDTVLENLERITGHLSGQDKCIDISIINPPMDIFAFWLATHGHDMRDREEMIDSFAKEVEEMFKIKLCDTQNVSQSGK